MFEVNIPKRVLDAALKIYDHMFQELSEVPQEGISHRGDFSFSHAVPDNWGSDIVWTSVYGDHTFETFLKLFLEARLPQQIRNLVEVDFEKDIAVYSSFFVTRGKVDRTSYHYDYTDTGTNAFTLMTPLRDYSNREKGHLLYTDDQGHEQVYRYKYGTGVFFGEEFCHSTEPCDHEIPMVFLCFTFGTDKMKHWPLIEPTAGQQGDYYRLPNGEAVTKS